MTTTINAFPFVTKTPLSLSNGGINDGGRRWFDQLVTRAQALALELMTADRDEADVLLRAFSESIPRPINALDRLVLRSVLLDVAFKSGATLHARLHGGLAVPCAFSPTTLLDRFWFVPSDDVQTHFDDWRQALFAELNRTHPPSLASSIGRLVKREVRKPWSLRELAHRFHATPSRIRRAFQQEFGMTVGEYQRLSRLAVGMPSLRHEKLEAVALAVGFRSPKNFYRAFQRLIGITPRTFKTMSAEQASDVHTTIRCRLLRGR
jgi:AraC-like DNA-binding protein